MWKKEFTADTFYCVGKKCYILENSITKETKKAFKGIEHIAFNDKIYAEIRDFGLSKLDSSSRFIKR